MRRLTFGIAAIALALVVALPAAALAASPSTTNMLKEQVASQAMIGSLMGTTSSHNSWISSITFGKVTRSSSKAVIKVTVRTHGGTSTSGVLVMRMYSGKWYFYSITRGSAEGGISNVAVPAGITTSAIGSSITEQSRHQWMLAGIVSGGYRKLTVLSRANSVSTRQVNIRLSGGSRRSVLGRVVAYRKTATSGKRYWFISSIK
jgi:hypothetical protein